MTDKPAKKAAKKVATKKAAPTSKPRPPAAVKNFNYDVVKSKDSDEFVATVKEFPLLSFVGENENTALKGLYKLVVEVLKDIEDENAADKVIAEKPTMHLVKMKRGFSYTTPSGKVFTKAHPYQLLEYNEMTALLEMPEDRFIEASPEEVKSYYEK